MTIVDDHLHGVTVHHAHDFGGLRGLVVALTELEQQDEDEDQQRHGGDAGTAQVVQHPASLANASSRGARAHARARAGSVTS